MQADWQAFLIQRGAVIEAGTVQRFDTPGVRETPADAQLFDLSQQGLLSVRGEDSESFLQGQLSSDMKGLADATQLTSYSTPQGRALAIMRAFRYGDSLQFLLPRELVEPMQLRLSRYVLRARVEIGSDDHVLGRIGLAGEKASELLARLALPDPPLAGSIEHAAALCVMNVTVAQPRYILVAPYQQIMRIWEGAEEHAQAAGQEIVARAQYLGRIKRRMFRFNYTGDRAPGAGDSIVLDDGSEIGTVVDAARAESGWRMLAVIRSEAKDQPLHHSDIESPVLQRLDLPYDIPPHKESA